MKHSLLFFLLLIVANYSANSIKGYSYYEQEYSQTASGSQITKYLNLSIKEGCSTKNYHHLAYVYEDASVYSTNIKAKLTYATLSVHNALRSKDKFLIANAYLNRAIIYYKELGDFKKSTRDLLYVDRALTDIEKKDLYLYHKSRYHIGMINQHLGYIDEAVKLFEGAAKYYKSQLEEPHYSKIHENHRKGLINSQYQLASCYSRLTLFQKSFDALKRGQQYIEDGKIDNIERARYNELLGVNYLKLEKYDNAYKYISAANNIYKELKHEKGIISTTYYIGEFYLKTGEYVKGINKLVLIDSLYNKKPIAMKETYLTYNSLLNSKGISENEKISFLTNKLQIDSLLNNSNVKISKLMLTELNNLSSNDPIINEHNFKWNIALLCSIIIVSGRMLQNVKIAKFKEIYNRNKKTFSGVENSNIYEGEKFKTKTISQEIINDILKKLELFEENCGYLDKNISLTNMAALFKSNTAHLSYVINTEKNIRFSNYINQLRIKYITELLISNPKYRSYTVQALATECGIASRQTFTKQFQSFNFSTPYEFIHGLNSVNNS